MRNMKKKVHLITLAAFPYSSAESIHLAMLSTAMACQCDYLLVTPVKPWRISSFRNDIYHFYGLPQDSFKRKKFLQLSPSSLNFIEKSIKYAKKQGAIVYARQAIVAKLALTEGLEVVLELHDLPSDATLEFISSQLKMDAFKGIVCISQALKSDVIHYCNVPKEIEGKVLVAPDGADDRMFSIRESKDELSVGYIGSDYPGKGLEVILPLAVMLPTVKFHLYGVEPESKNLASFKPISPNIICHGKIPFRDVPAAINTFDIALLPNQPQVIMANGSDIGRYTSPMKMFEYMAAGKAIVASDLAILKEVLIHEDNSLLAKHNDLDSWCRAINRLLVDSKLLESVQRKARQDFLEKYTYSARAASIFNALLK